jgi:dTMP kinase
MQARFLVMEGVDGSGKTTQAEALLAWMRSLGRDPVHLREPGTTQIGERLRKLLLDPNRDPCSPRTEALLFFAARGELLRLEVAPALAAGRDVICERFTPSTLAYQGQSPDDREFILDLDEIVVGAHQPDLVLLLDLPASRSWQRTQSRAGKAALDSMESRGLEFLERVRAGYLAYAAARPQQSALLEVDGWDRDRVQVALRQQLQSRFPHEFAGQLEA